MRLIYKILIVACLVLTILSIVYLNSTECIEYDQSKPDICLTHQSGWEKVTLLFMSLTQSWVVWLVVAIPVILLIVYIVSEYLGIWGKVKVAKKFNPNKRIPQEKRIEMLKDWINNKFMLEIDGKPIVMVDNYILPERDDAQPGELILFTTSQQYKDRRIKEEEIPAKEAFYGYIHCITGECQTMGFLSKITFEGAVKFYNRYWFMSIKQRVETPIEMWMKKAMAEATGQEFVRKEMSTDKKEVKNENED